MGCAINFRVSNRRTNWDNRVIPYIIDSNDFPDNMLNRNTIESAIKNWNLHMNVQFIEKRPRHWYFVRFKSGNVCESNIGNIRSAFTGQNITCNLTNRSNGEANILHEMGHAAGLFHEHQREDRNDYVIVDTSLSANKNFIQLNEQADDIGIYDYGSIMHYDENFPSVINALVPRKPLNGIDMGQRNGFSRRDIEAIAEKYGHSDVPINNIAVNKNKIYHSYSNRYSKKGWGVYVSDSEDIGFGAKTNRVYGGEASADKMIPYKDGVIIAYVNYKTGNPWGIYYHPSSGSPAKVYDGDASVEAMIPYKNGIIIAFVKNQKSWGVYYYKNERVIKAGRSSSRIHDGGDTGVEAMIPYKNGVIIAFYNYNSGKSWGAYYYKNESSLSSSRADARVYDGPKRIGNMVAVGSNVITSFNSRTSGRVYRSPDGYDLNGGGNSRIIYSGVYKVKEIFPYKNGIITTFRSRHRADRCRGAFFSQNLNASSFAHVENSTRIDTPLKYSPFPRFNVYKNGLLITYLDGNLVHYSPDENISNFDKVKKVFFGGRYGVGMYFRS